MSVLNKNSTWGRSAVRRKRRSDIRKERPLYMRSRRTPDNYGISESKYNELKYKNALSQQQIKEKRNEIKQAFPAVDANLIDSYNCLDQGPDGACMIAATFNLLNIVGKNKHHGLEEKNKREKSWLKLKQSRNWNILYADVVMNVDGNYKKEAGDYDQLLENGAAELPFVNMLKDPSFRYVPILSGGRENYFNKDVVESHPDDPIRGIREYIEGLLDIKIPIAISWNGHARVVIGYNESELLFADSWGNNWEELNIMTVVDSKGKRQQVEDHFRAGFSSMDKRFIYPNIRDCMYFVEPPTPSVSPKKESAPAGQTTPEKKQTKSLVRRSTRARKKTPTFSPEHFSDVLKF